MELNDELLDKLIEGYQKPEDLIGENGLLKQLTKRLIERAMNAELTHQLGYEKHEAEGRGSGNSRNGKSRKKLKGDFGEIEIEVPRDRAGQYEPKIVAKHQRRFEGFPSPRSALRPSAIAPARRNRHFERPCTPNRVSIT